MIFSSLLVAISLGHADSPDLGHFLPPGSPLAGVDGAISHWTNPANLGFDPDDSSSTMLQGPRDLSDWTLASAFGSGDSSVGLIHRRYDNGDRWWSAGFSQGIRLSDSFRIGAQSQWNWGGDRDVFYGMDFGLSYRPNSWFGLGAVTRNAIGDTSETPKSYNTGLVLRPLGDSLYLGADYQVLASSDSMWTGTTTASLVIQPYSGLRLRGQIDDQKNWGVGIAVQSNSGATGVFSSGLAETMTYSVTSGEPGQESQGRTSSNEAPFYKLGKRYDYEPVEGFFGDKESSYLNLLQRLRNSANDPEVDVIALSTEGMAFSYAQLQEIHRILSDAKTNGKELFAYLGEWSSLKEYYIASLCDKVTMHPSGNLIFTGIGIEQNYFAGTLALVGVTPEFSKQGDYKSAVEMYTRTGASEKAEEQTEALLDDLWTSLVAGIAYARGLSEEAVTEAIDAGPMTASQAIEGGWVDEVVFPTDFKKVVQQEHLSITDFDDSSGMVSNNQSGWEQPDSVAVITVSGPIVSGKSSRANFLGGGNAGAATISAALRSLKKRDDVKAVVLRVDSPGGSASASEDIWKAVTEVQESGRPVVVSMGGVAASGGYYVAASADAILAEPTTITGSIGAFAGRFTFQNLYEKLGVTTELSGRGRMANMFSISKPMDPMEWERFDALAQDVYRRFVEKVAEGRGMSVEEVEAVASGRVWSGEDALEQGLIDQLGGFEEAITLAAEKAEMEPGYRTISVGMDLKEDLKDEIIRNLGVKSDISESLPAPLLDMMRYEWLLNEHLFMMLPYQMTVY